MTFSPCIAADRIAEADGLPPDHPVSKHVSDCPRCSALLLAYHDFVAATDVPEGADVEDATRRLSAGIARIVRPHEAAGPRRARASSLGSRIATWWAGPVRWPALATAALVIVATGWWAMRAPAPDESAWRGGDRVPTLEWRAVAVGSEALALHWSSVPGASLYGVTLLGPALEPRVELPLSTDTTALLERAQWPASAPGETLYVRVDAMRDGSVLAMSPLEPVLLHR